MGIFILYQLRVFIKCIYYASIIIKSIIIFWSNLMRKSFWILLFFIICVNILFINPAFANLLESATTSLPSYSQILMKTVVSLFIVIVMIYVVFWIYIKLNKYNSKKFGNVGDKTHSLTKLKLVSHLSLGQNKSVEVIEVNNQYLVLGVTSENINLLNKFNKQNNDNNISKESTNSLDDEKIEQMYRKYFNR